MNAVKRRLALSMLLLLVLPLFADGQEANRQAQFGKPSAARADTSQREDYLIERPQYVVGYNAKLNRPNWVSWSLRGSDIGKATRGKFELDPLLPRSFQKISSNVYDGGGFDRGHMCPAQDRSSTQNDMNNTFLMTNVVPQSPHNNQRGWERLEAYCRELAKTGHVLHIVCGPQGTGGTGRNGPRDEIGHGGVFVNVPAKVWKVILVLPNENAAPTRSTRSIAVIMPNDASVDWDWPKYRVSVQEVEKLTGYTFFRDLPAEIAGNIKNRVDDVKVRVPKSKFGVDL